jgi:AcrR family transcriptional regulator
MGEGGIQLLTTKNLAREVGVTEPALYRHFTDKVDILQNVLEYLRSRILDRLEKITGSDLNPEDKLRELVNRQFTAFSNRPEVVVVLLSEGLYQNNKLLSSLVYSIMKESEKYYIKVIQDGQDAGTFRDDLPARQCAFLIMGTMRLCVIQWHLSGFEYSLKEKGDSLLQTLFTLLKASSRQV